MPGFPYLSPLKPWIRKKLETRESNPQALNTLSPFIILSSAAVVTNEISDSDAVRQAIQTQKFPANSYYGCVVTNTSDISKLYQTGKTIVGYDLNGKAIEVEGETNRRVSTPIITQLEIDTDGGNNTLKDARVDIKVFTLKQLEMFEMFFLRPSMNVVLEYGHNADINRKVNLGPLSNNQDIPLPNVINSKLFAKKKYEDYKKAFFEIFSHKDDSYQKAKTAYLKTLEDTNGDYDFMAGKVTNFTFSPEADGTYNINLTISAGNELQLWMPNKQGADKSQTKKKNKKEEPVTYSTWVNKLAADLRLESLSGPTGTLSDKKKWENEFFNWGMLNTTQKDTTFSKNMYISVRLILEIINNSQKYSIAKEKIATKLFFEDSAKTIPIIPINSDKYLMSSTDDVIIPGYLPDIKVVTDEKKKDIIILDTSDKAKPVKALIKGYKFNVSQDAKAQKFIIYDDDAKPIEIPSVCGNLLNIFVKYDSFVTLYNGAYTQADVMNSLVGLINGSMYGLCTLELSKSDDLNSNEPLTIIDRKLQAINPTTSKKDIYRFKAGVSGSIMHEFSFNMELSTLAQAQALYSSQLALNQALKTGTKDSGSAVANNDEYMSADLSYAKNADGYFSVNVIEMEIVKDAAAFNKEQEAKLGVTPSTNNNDADGEKKNMAEVLKEKFVRFKLTPDDKTGVGMIFQDASLIQNKITTKTNVSALTYLDISFGIDGMSGLSCGEYFLIQGVPEIYNRNGYFQITNVKQGINENGWKTTVEAGYRLNND